METKFQTETYGRYEIRSGPVAGAWAANAYRREVLVARTRKASRELAVNVVKAELDSLDGREQSGHDHEGAPPSRVYEDAFVLLIPTFPDSYLAMLRAHLSAPDQLLSATRLAAAAGYTGYGGANLHYGKLGQRVAEEIGFIPPQRADGSRIWTCAIARDRSAETEFPDTCLVDASMRNVDDQHFEWQMRPQVVQALRALGW